MALNPSKGISCLACALWMLALPNTAAARRWSPSTPLLRTQPWCSLSSFPAGPSTRPPPRILGIDALHVYALPAGSAQALFVAAADSSSYGWYRSDIASVFGAQFLRSGYGLTVAGLAPGQVQAPCLCAPEQRLSVDGGRRGRLHPGTAVDEPGHSLHMSHLLQPFGLGGWAVDLAAASGTGVDGLHFWASRRPAVPPGGSARRGLLMEATVRGDRMSAMRSAPAFHRRGSTISSPDCLRGVHLVAYAHSAVSNNFPVFQVVHLFVDVTLAAPTPSRPSGTVNAGDTVTLTVADPAATIRYTTDGTDPTASSPQYNGQLHDNVPRHDSGSGVCLGLLSEPNRGLYLHPTSACSCAEPRGRHIFQLSGPGHGIVVPDWRRRYGSTVDGTDPTPSSPVFPSALYVDEFTGIRAALFRPNWAASNVVAATYVPSEVPVPRRQPR